MPLVQCSYINVNGSTAETFCPSTCCTGDIKTETDACCEYGQFTGLYLGASIGTVTLVGLLCLCLACLCFKEKVCKQYRTGNPFTVYRQNRRSTNPQLDLELTVPKGPPAYDTLDFPPPYSLISEVASYSTAIPKTLSTPAPDHPPPEYSEHADEDD